MAYFHPSSMKQNSVGHILLLAPHSLARAAMSLPALAGVVGRYPELKVTVVAPFGQRALYEPFVGVEFVAIDEPQYGGLRGAVRLAAMLRKSGVAAVVSLEKGFRLRLLALLLRGERVRLRRPSGETRPLTRKYRKTLAPITPYTERVKGLFEAVGLPAEAVVMNECGAEGCASSVVDILLGEKCCPWIGLSLLTPNHGTCYPLPKAARLIELLAARDCKVVLFGADGYERQFAEGMQSLYENVVSVAGRLPLEEQLNLLTRLDTLVCVDNNLLRLAALKGTRTVVLWGATHPYLDPLFTAEGAVVDMQCKMACRPCSTDGRRNCLFGHYKCMNSHTPDEICSNI